MTPSNAPQPARRPGHTASFSRRSSVNSGGEHALDLPATDAWTILCRVMVLVALFYAVIRFGAVHAGTQYHVCLIMLGAVIAALMQARPQSFPRPRIVGAILSLWLLWLILTAFQSFALPESVVRWLSPQATSIRERFAGTDASGGWQTVSLVPMMTQLAWSNYAIGLVFFLLGATVWSTRKSRVVFLAAIGIGGGLLATWGLVQRAKNSDQMLPGFDAPERTLPFATLIYKNAGAAILIAAMAASIGLLLVMLRPALRAHRSRGRRSPPRSESRSSTKGTLATEKSLSPASGYSKRGYWSEPNVVAIYVLLAILSLGLMASLSKGGWIAGAVALCTWAYFMRRYVTPRTSMIIGLFLAVFGGTAIYLTGMRDLIATRTDQMTYDTLLGNDRFQHWRDAAESVLQYPIVGSGLGTYGYAQLPNQDRDTARWFHHAHSQPLEWAVETGIVGVLVLISGLAMTMVLLLQLYRDRRKGSTPLIWFSVLLIAVIGLLVQSIVDFVLLTPAVLWTYALMLGVAASATADRESKPGRGSTKPGRGSIRTADQADPESNPLLQKWGDRLAGPFVWSLAAAATLLIGQRWLQDEILDETLLRTTRLPRRIVTPTDDQVKEARQRLQKRAAQHPINGKLWQRLALWDMARYRLDLIEVGKANNESLSWADTSPQVMFQVFHAMKPELQESTRELWMTEQSQREAIDAAKANFEKSILRNPLVPQVHLQIALMSVLTGDDYGPAARHCRELSRSNGDLQFANGLLAFHVGDLETMIDQWRRCLRFKPENLPYVLQLAASVLKPQELCDQVLSDLRSPIWVSLVRQSQQDERMEPFREVFVHSAIKSIQADQTLKQGRQRFLLALMSDFAGDSAQSTIHLHEAVRAEPANSDYRYRLAIALVNEGNLADAREQVSLGRSLDSGGKRWQELLGRIDRLFSARPPHKS